MNIVRKPKHTRLFDAIRIGLMCFVSPDEARYQLNLMQIQRCPGKRYRCEQT